MSLASGLQSALQADSPLLFFGLEVIFPGFNLRLLDGAGQVTINGNLFVGLDATYGALAAIDGWSDGVSAEAVHLTFQIQPPTNSAAAALCQPGNQGAVVNLYFGAVDRVSGLAVTSPYLIWTGDLDTMTLATDRNSQVVKFDAESTWDRFFDTDEGILLDNATHQAIWAGELGLEYVTYVQMQLPWGSDAPRPIVVTDSIGGVPGGAGFGVGGWRPSAYLGDIGGIRFGG